MPISLLFGTVRKGSQYSSHCLYHRLFSASNVYFSSSLPRFVFVSGGAFYCFCLLHQCVKLVFSELFSAKPHVFLQKDNPLALKKVVFLHNLAPYLRLNFVQGQIFFFQEFLTQFYANFQSFLRCDFAR